MSRLPKIKLKLPSGGPIEYLFELEEAGQYLNFNEGIFTVDGRGIQSCEELVIIAAQDKYKNQEFIEVVLLQPIDGG